VGLCCYGAADSADVGVQSRVLDGAVVVRELHGGVLAVDLDFLFLETVMNWVLPVTGLVAQPAATPRPPCRPAT